MPLLDGQTGKDLRVYLEAVVSDVSDLEQITAVFNDDQPLTRLYFSRG